jgi:Kef-type K+ transport system membrane component KefB
LEANSLPLYALFFALAGASLTLSVVPSVWKIMALLILLRAVLIFASTKLGATLTGEHVSIRRYAWLGFTAQAGVTLGIASMISEQFGPLGVQIASIVIAMIAVHELVGPPLFRLAVQLSGESGTQPDVEDARASAVANGG